MPIFAVYYLLCDILNLCFAEQKNYPDSKNELAKKIIDLVKEWKKKS